MAAPQTPEANEIRRRGRQRLIGAVAIALLLIVFVPMLLDSEPRTAAREEPRLEIPPRENAPPLPAPRPAENAAPNASVAPAPSAAAPATSAQGAEQKAAADAKPGGGTDAKAAARVAVLEPKADAPGKTAKAEPATKSSAKPDSASAKAPAKGEGFVIQVGAFRDDAKLQQAREKLAAANITTYTEPSGSLTRLRVGPFPTREAAEKTLGNVRRAVPEAKVVPNQ